MLDVWVGGLAENAASQHFMQLTAAKLELRQMNGPGSRCVNIGLVPGPNHYGGVADDRF